MSGQFPPAPFPDISVVSCTMSDQPETPEIVEDEEDKQSDFIKFFVVIAAITVLLGAVVWWFQSQERQREAVQVKTLSDGTKWGLLITEGQECGPAKQTWTGIVQVPEDRFEDLIEVFWAAGCNDATEFHVFEDQGVWVTSHQGVLTACGPLFAPNEFEVKVGACIKHRAYIYQEQRCSFHNELKPHFPSLTPIDLDPENCPRLTPISAQ